MQEDDEAERGSTGYPKKNQREVVARDNQMLGSRELIDRFSCYVKFTEHLACENDRDHSHYKQRQATEQQSPIPPDNPGAGDRQRG